jgi:hypothetical protein
VVCGISYFKSCFLVNWGYNMRRMFCYFVLVVIVSYIVLTGCSNSNPNQSSADWAYSFVVWDGYLYQIGDEYVEDIGEEIGEVTKYSDMEGGYSGNFSNEYEKGTKYYAIKGISTEEAIAIEESDGRFRKANREGKYEGRSAFDGFFDGQQGIIKILIFSIMGILAVFFIYKISKE